MRLLSKNGGAAIACAIAVLASVFAAIIYVRVISTHMPASWDEAAHSLFALTIATDIRKADLLALAYDTYRQTYWPPMHSWVVGIAFLLVGPSMTAARAVSLVAYVLIPVALVLGARLFHPPEDDAAGWIAGGTAGLLAIAMPALVPFASIAFIDLPALLGVCLTLVATFYAERKPDQPKRRLLVGVGVFGCFLFKTNYGLVLMAAYGLDAVADAGFSLRRLFSKRNLYLAVPIIIGLAIWFAYVPKLYEAFNAMVNVPTAAGRWTRDGLLFYVITLRTFAGSDVMLLVLLVAFAFSVSRWREPNVRILLLLATVQLVVGELHQTKEDRHILPMLPPLILLTSVGVARLLTRGDRSLPPRLAYVPKALGASLGALMIVQLGQIALRPMPLWQEPAPPPLGPLQQAIVATVEAAKARGERVLVLGTRSLPVEVPHIDWDLAATRGWMDVDQAGAIGLPDHGYPFAEQIKASRLPPMLRRALVRVVTRGDAPSLVKTMYAGHPAVTDSVTFARWVRRTIDAGGIDIVLLATTLDQTKYPLAWFAPLIDGGGLVHQATGEVQEERRVRVDEYRVRRQEPSRR